MPDTGAPWNIPYVAGTDLVSDWPTDSQTLATAIADGLDAANLGIGTNVVQTVKTDTFSESVAAGGVGSDVTGLTATITPSSATSKVMVLVSISVSNQEASTNAETYCYLYRDASVSTFIGDASSSAKRASAAMSGSSLERGPSMLSFTFVDSPATTSAVTYSLRLGHSSSATTTVYVNRAQNASTNLHAVTASSLVLVEVAA